MAAPLTTTSAGTWALASGSPPPSTAAQGVRLGARDRLALAVGLLAVGGWRVLQARGLELPAWVDAVHHTLLVRLFLEQGRIPSSWGPYLPDVPMYYHFGFHLTAAVLAWLAGWGGVQLGRAVLVAGQLWQLALAAGVYALALRLWKRPARALSALLLVGFVSEMPAYYVTWSRYTLLAGLALMVWGMVAALDARPLLLATAIAATAVTHYYAFVLLLAFVGCAIAASAPQGRRRLAGGAALGLLVSAPWLLRVWHFTRAFARAHTPGASAGSSPSPQLHLWSLLGPDRNHLLLVVAAAGLGLLAFRALRRRLEDPVAGWALLGWTLVVLALLARQLGPFRPDHAAIVLFLPAVLLGAEALWALLPRAAVWPVLSLLVLWGALETGRVVNPETVFTRPGDTRAMEWIDAQTRPDATFLVDVQPWMGIWRGADGGWWITPLTGRRTVLPPLAYSWAPPERAEPIRATAAQVHELGLLSGKRFCAELRRLMARTGAGYYYSYMHQATVCSDLDVAYRGADGLGIYVTTPRAQAGPGAE